ncbi:MAG TPA: hypothetical protein VFY05_03310 [Candidatus Angelobacter sp.]|nr:hypothetical protein [Candidatus Angelobacter sp.]
MQAPKTIPRSGRSDTCTNYHELLRHGLRHCQQLGGDLWTDYNEHDPGVTILQQLCFALTDLAYRTDFAISDILARPDGVPQPDHALYTGDRILTSDPVTVDDYRKFLYDSIKGLKNAWLEPIRADQHPLGIRGLYRVFVETQEEVEEPSEIEEIRLKVKRLMREKRNLGEDVDEVCILKPQPVRLEGTIEVGPKANPSNVLAQVLFDIQNSLIPFPQAHSVDQLFHKLPPDQIWNGPALKHGLVEESSLSERKRVLQLQEIAKIMLRVKGVKRVKRLKICTPPDAPSREPLLLKEDHVPRLDPPILKPQPRYTINVELEGGFKCVVDSWMVWSRIQELESDLRKQIAYAARSLSVLSYRHLPSGTYRGIEDYLSIQHQFPAIYGLGKYGMGDNLVEKGLTIMRPDSARAARIRQLKAYLLFFEQPLANYLAQLSRVGDLFSLDENLHRSYFHQPLAHDPPGPSEPRKITDVLLQQRREPRKSTGHYLVAVIDGRGEIAFVSRRLPSQSVAQEIKRQIIESGQEIANYRIINRGPGDVQLDLHNSAGSFLAQGQEHFTASGAARGTAERWASFIRGAQHNKALLDKAIKVFRREDLTLQIIDEENRVLLTSDRIQTEADRVRRIGEILASGIDRRNYRFHPITRGGFNIHLHDTNGELLAEGEEIFETEFDAEEGVDRLVHLLRRMAENESVRNHHLRRRPEVEEIGRNLLRPYYEGLDRLSRQADRDYLRRRNRILNHLLARFGEWFDDAILERLDLRPYGEKDSFYEELIRWKIEFLRNYVEHDRATVALGAGRSRGFDYGAREDSDALSGLERRAALLLGLNGHATDHSYHSHRSNEGPDTGFHYLDKPVRPLEPERLQDQDGIAFTLARERIETPRLAGEPDLNDLHHNFVFSSEDSSVLQQLLASGRSRENYRLHAYEGGYRILFQPGSSQHAQEIHHARTRREAEQSIDALVRYFRELKQETQQWYGGERMHVVEHILLRPHENVRQYCVRIADSHLRVHLVGVPVESSHRKAHLNLILQHGQDAVNYRIKTHGPGRHYFVLHDNEKPIATGTTIFASEQETAAAIERLMEVMRSLGREPDASRKLPQASVADDFYSNRVSVFLPNWPMRFQNNEFKLYAEQLLAENAPAHLAVECFWLSMHEIREFERLLREWKNLKRTVELGNKAPEHTGDPIAQLNEASGQLKAMIESLQRRQQNQRAPEDEGREAGLQ